MAVHLVYSHFLISLQLLFESHQPVMLGQWKGHQKHISGGILSEQNHQKEKSLGMLQKNIARKPNFINMELRKDASHHLILIYCPRDSLATLSDHLTPTQQRHSNGVIALHKYLNPAQTFYSFAANKVNKNFGVSK